MTASSQEHTQSAVQPLPVPSVSGRIAWSRYQRVGVQVVEKKKELASKCSALEEEVRIGGGIKQEAHRLEQRCQQLQASNTAIKRQLSSLQQQTTESKATDDQVGHADCRVLFISCIADRE